MKAKTEECAVYRLPLPDLSADDQIIEQAKEILARRMSRPAVFIDSPATVRDYLTVNYAALDHEIFGVIWLDARNGVIRAEQLFNGTLTQTSVYPREIVKAGLAANAAAVIFFHNHPSGANEPSTADEVLTRALQSALGMVDIRVLDHFIVAGMQKPYSFAEHGLL